MTSASNTSRVSRHRGSTNTVGLRRSPLLVGAPAAPYWPIWLLFNHFPPCCYFFTFTTAFKLKLQTRPTFELGYSVRKPREPKKSETSLLDATGP
jgi:hypothetical protein